MPHENSHDTFSDIKPNKIIIPKSVKNYKEDIKMLNFIILGIAIAIFLGSVGIMIKNWKENKLFSTMMILIITCTFYMYM